VDLAELDAVAAARDARWRLAGLTWEVVRWPITDKPAASLRLTSGVGEGELILWVSGEAEVNYRRTADSEPVAVHHDFASAQELAACVDGLVRQIGPT
jgi:hypothetical protein